MRRFFDKIPHSETWISQFDNTLSIILRRGGAAPLPDILIAIAA